MVIARVASCGLCAGGRRYADDALALCTAADYVESPPVRDAATVRRASSSRRPERSPTAPRLITPIPSFRGKVFAKGYGRRRTRRPARRSRRSRRCPIACARACTRCRRPDDFRVDQHAIAIRISFVTSSARCHSNDPGDAVADVDASAAQRNDRRLGARPRRGLGCRSAESIREVRAPVARRASAHGG